MDPKSPLPHFDIGSGEKTLILVHGFCETKNFWKGFAEDLLPDIRIIIPDLPGFGESLLHSTDKVSIEFYADKLNELLEWLKISSCTMLGHSMGGYVTLAFAEKHPSKVEKIGLFHSTAYEDTPQKKDNRNRTIEFIQKHGMEKFGSSFVAPLFFHKNRDQLKEEINFLSNEASSCNQAAVIAATEAMRERKDRAQVLKEINIPVLFIIGEEDPAVPLEKSMEQSKLAQQAEVHLLPKTGHMGMFERKKQTIQIVKAFVA